MRIHLIEEVDEELSFCCAGILCAGNTHVHRTEGLPAKWLIQQLSLILEISMGSGLCDRISGRRMHDLSNWNHQICPQGSYVHVSCAVVSNFLLCGSGQGV